MSSKWLRPWSMWTRERYNPLGQQAAASTPTTPIVDQDEKDEDDEDDLELGTNNTQRQNNNNNSQRLALVLTSTAALLLLILFLFAPRPPWVSRSPPPPTLQYYHCPNSSTDAAAAGCRFDVLSYAWLHPDCFDQELTYDFLGAVGNEWYGDEDGQEVLGVTEVAGGERNEVWVRWGYYLRHCTYMWKKMHRSLLTSKALDGYAMNYGHTQQCELALLDRERAEDGLSVLLVVKYPACPVLA